ASAGAIAGPLPPPAVALTGGPLVEEPGCVTRAFDIADVGTVTTGTTAGAASAMGVSPAAVFPASAVPESVPQLPVAPALDAVLTPAPAAVGATPHGSVAAVASAPAVSGETSAPAAASVGAVTSGAVAPAASTCGSPSTTGATSTASPVAA